MKTLHIAPTLSLPLEFVTQTQAILAKRGVGKSFNNAIYRLRTLELISGSGTIRLSEDLRAAV